MLSHDQTATPSLPGVREPGRIAVLERVEELTGTADPALDRVARLAARLLSAPAAYVTLVGAVEQRSPGAAELDTVGEPMRRLDVQDSLCQFQVVTDEPLVIEDARRDPLTEHNRTVLDGSLGAYAGMPLRSAGGHVLGSLCVVDRAPRAWDETELTLLDDLAAVVTTDLEHRLSADRAGQVEDRARRLLDQWRPHADAVAALVELAEQSDDPHLQRSAARARATGGRVGQASTELARTTQVAPVIGTARRSSTDLRRLVQRAVDGARSATGTSALVLELADSPLPVSCDPVQVERALVHLLVSAMHHSASGRPLEVRLTASGPTDGQLSLSAPSTQVPAAELARLVSRFSQAVDACASGPTAPASLRMLRGGVQATSGSVTGTSSADGLQFRARWALAAPEVIDLT